MSWSIVCGCGVLEGAAHEEALHLHGEEGLEDGGGIEVERAAKAWRWWGRGFVTIPERIVWWRLLL